MLGAVETARCVTIASGYIRILRLTLTVFLVSQFGDCRQKPKLRTGHGVLGQWKSMQALACHEGIESRRMCMHEGIMITKRQAMKSLWGDFTVPVFASKSAFNKSDSSLRQAFIQTYSLDSLSLHNITGLSPGPREQLQVLLHNITGQNSGRIKDGDAGVTIRAFAFASSFSCKKYARVAARVSRLWLA